MFEDGFDTYTFLDIASIISYIDNQTAPGHASGSNKIKQHESSATIQKMVLEDGSASTSNKFIQQDGSYAAIEKIESKAIT